MNPQVDSWAEASAFAKVNLYLRIFPRAADDFHPVETVLCRISLADRVRLRLRAGRDVSVRVVGPESAPEGPENLAARAATLLLERVATPSGVEIELEKRVPAGSGLGGGSSDAATVLQLVSAKLEADLGVDQRRELASALGTDVAFFAADRPLALGTGRGDRLSVLPKLPPRPLLVVLPYTHVSTAAAYRLWDEWSHSAEGALSIARPPTNWTSLSSWEDVRSLARNDFESVVFQSHPSLGLIKESLVETEPLVALLSGSGSGLFAVYDDDGRRDAAATRLRDVLRNVRIVSARGPV